MLSIPDHHLTRGKKTGNTPDGRRHGEPLEPAQTDERRDVSGVHWHVLNSAIKLSYCSVAAMASSNTFSSISRRGAPGKTG